MKEQYNYLLNKSRTYTKDLYRKENLSDEIYIDNMKDLDIWAKKYEKENGVKGLYKEHFEWVNNILEMKVIKLGRLQFEIMEKTDDDLQNILKKNCPIENFNKNFLFINVHIREGEKLEFKACEKSYKMAENFYKSKGYSFSKIVFVCYSWLLNPDLKILLPENSNIIRFQKKYNIFFSNENEEKPQIIERIFEKTEKDIENWEQNTILQKKLKEAWLKGQRFPMTKGYFMQ